MSFPLAIPQPSAGVDVFGICQAIEAQLAEVSDVTTLKDVAARLGAIDQYIAATSTQGRAQVQATIRRITQRVGEVLGAAHNGGDRRSDQFTREVTDSLTPNERMIARRFAEHPDVVDDVIANSDDDAPPSQAKVLEAIAAKKAAAKAQQRADDADEREWLDSLGPVTDAAGDRRRQQIHMAIIAVDDATKALDRYTADEIDWAIQTAFEHLRPAMTNQLRASMRRLRKVTP
jgi:hypothetical protein